MSEPIRVLQIVAKMERNGYESRIMDIYRNLDRDKVQFDFYTQRKEQGDFDEEICSLGGQIFYNNPIHPLRFFQYLGQLNSFFSNHHYKIVHSHLNSYSAWGLFAAKRNNVKVRIAHSRNSGFDPGWKTIFKKASKLFVNLPPTHRFACSQNAGMWLFGKTFLSDPNSKVIPNAFNCDAFTFDNKTRLDVREELGLGKEIAVVNVGRLSPPKNHFMLLKIFSVFKENNPCARLFLFGEGELEEQIKERASVMGIDEAIVFMGNRADVNRYLNGMDILLFPSVYEGFGTVTIEAQCNGLPVLASNVLPEETQLTELIQYESLNAPISSWADKMKRLLMECPRKDHSSVVKNAGYDMKINAQHMQEFYLQSIKS